MAEPKIPSGLKVFVLEKLWQISKPRLGRGLRASRKAGKNPVASPLQEIGRGYLALPMGNS